ncbi:MAG TPA: metalloregulator ArsR/SmtB family transcription factor [Candidatus Polarisedimenticolaceae bacterium]|nr:metalloregulator ArsR/SmtB family transcription factor [Candidatus Polarisedimenticolaceae bacterium]
MDTTHRPQIFDQMSSLADRVRSRILLAVEDRELTVSELCSVLQLPQSTVSRHLKTLGDTGWVLHRPDGTRRLYQFTPAELDATARDLWALTRAQVQATASALEDGRRLAGVLSRRRTRSREFFSEAAERWDRVRDEMFGSGFHALALLGLLDPRMRVADLGCGTGAVSAALAPVVEQVFAVDDSASMLAAAAERLAGFDNVDLRQGQLEAVPLDDDSVDAATLVLVLHHIPEPARVLSEVARVLIPGGRLLIVDMLPHERSELQQEMGHVWMGFDEPRLGRFLAPARLELSRFIVIPPDADAMGPTLFAATAAA